MNHKRILFYRAASICMMASAFSASAIACSTTPTHYRGSLSDAMDKSRDDYEGERTVPDWQRAPDHAPPPQYPADDQYGSTEAVFDGDDAPGPSEFWMGFRGGNGYHASRDMQALADGDIFAGGEVSPNLEIDLHAGFKVTEAVVGSALDERVKDPQLFLKAGLEGRYSPLPDWPVFSPYLSAGMGIFYMGWTFRNALVSGYDTISSDGITGFMMSTGAGFYILNLERFRIGLGVQPEMYLFGTVTGEGFDNDYFDYFGSIKVVAEMSMKL